MNIFVIIFGLIIFAIFVIFVWEMIKSMVSETTFFNDASIYEVMEYIDNALLEARFYDYEMMFRTPDCKVYKKFNLHVAKRKENDKEVIMIDLD